MNSGLDYTKIIIVNNINYIGVVDAVVDTDEYKETRENIDYIKNDSQAYIDTYIDYIQGKSTKYDERNFHRTYGFSTLKYFHNELGI